MDATCQTKVRKTLADGTVKEYTYTRSYTRKDDKTKKRPIIDKITQCDDPEKIKQISEAVDRILSQT